jgi:UDP-N-acetylmuramoyl-L-alanyl-D-glutamate--2,6-diaminopimelate ligase
MDVSSILNQFSELSLEKGNLTQLIDYIQSDSRKVKPKDLYCFYNENIIHADKYLKIASDLNCSQIILSHSAYNKINDLINQFKFTLVVLSKENSSKIHGNIASFLMGNPSEKLNLVAVTGTNGKTTITSVLYELFSKLNIPSGLIGTIQIKYGNKVFDSGYTTPDPSTLQLVLHEMVLEKIEYVFIEASSHGLKLGRMNGCHLRAALFSNLTPDHLDFHGDMNDYLNSKFILFQLLESSIKKSRVAILSLDSPGTKDMLDLIDSLNPTFKVSTFGLLGDYSGRDLCLSLEKTTFQIHFHSNVVQISTKLLGNYNFLNIGLVFSITCELISNSHQEIAKILGEVEPVVGRFEIIHSKTKDRIGIVDYAHTPDALENILKTIQEIPHSTIITVFGCGGDRDTQKRPLMGEIACKYSEFVILTSDNPRSEDPLSILADIEKGIKSKYTNYKVEVDRRNAILMGVQMLPKNGFLLIAGKGHENYQIIGTKKFSFSDKEELKKAFSIGVD